jgi:hypothetical protein
MLALHETKSTYSETIVFGLVQRNQPNKPLMNAAPQDLASMEVSSFWGFVKHHDKICLLCTTLEELMICHTITKIHHKVWQNNESQFDPVQVSCGTEMEHS